MIFCFCEQIWVNSPHNASGYYMIYGDDSLHAEHFDSHLATGDTSSQYARTGFLGFVRRTELTQSDGGWKILYNFSPGYNVIFTETKRMLIYMYLYSVNLWTMYGCFSGRHDAIFVVGALDETVMLRGMRYHPIDIETSVVRCHRKICEW